ncbi:hypothetical protein BDZ85DRAFT_61833 [Elsinoe ampelina]|uniref:Uncharacterized protein n=1 Tax=Elsinoe ampelina TaxID=302913 RepID=A0A6A6FZT1_9PEZI|nr:hypothetical protein BDZ85DRAFT_61833 [Elsinoe ampelina]
MAHSKLDSASQAGRKLRRPPKSKRVDPRVNSGAAGCMFRCRRPRGERSPGVGERDVGTGQDGMQNLQCRAVESTTARVLSLLTERVQRENIRSSDVFSRLFWGSLLRQDLLLASANLRARCWYSRRDSRGHFARVRRESGSGVAGEARGERGV